MYVQEYNKKGVTILVLVEYSLQSEAEAIINLAIECHNPCFSRILFAIFIPKLVQTQPN